MKGGIIERPEAPMGDDDFHLLLQGNTTERGSH